MLVVILTSVSRYQAEICQRRGVIYNTEEMHVKEVSVVLGVVVAVGGRLVVVVAWCDVVVVLVVADACPCSRGCTRRGEIKRGDIAMWRG